MIELDIKPYCNDCPYFEPKITQSYFYIGKGKITLVGCEEWETCKNIENYLEKSMMQKEKENSSGEDTNIES